MAAVTAARAWVLAARPRTLTAVIAPVVVGAALAAADGAFVLLPAVAALIGGALIQIGTNIANDYYDYVKGADTPERLGTVRVTQAGLLAPERVRRGMLVVFGLAVLVGLYLATVGGWPIVLVGIVSIAAGILYTAGPVALGYVGLGDLLTFAFFGPVAVGGTYYVQAHRLSGDVVLAGAGVGAVVTAILVVNNLRDARTDAVAGKRTLAVRIGARWTRVEYVLLLVAGAAVPVIGWRQSFWSGAAVLALAAFLLAAAPLRLVFTFRDPRDLNAALGGTARFVGAYGIAFAAGLLA